MTAVVLQPLFQVQPVNEIHDDADAALAFIEIVDWAYVEMAQFAGNQDFAAKGLDIAPVFTVILFEKFYRQGDAEFGVLDLVDIRRSALADKLPTAETQ